MTASHRSVNIGAVLAPIIETDDIAVDAAEQQQSSTTNGPRRISADGANPPSGAELTAVESTPRISASRRPSFLARTVETTKWAIEQHAPPRLSWSALRDRICRVGSKHAKTPPEVIRAMKPRARIQFYLTQPEESRFGWLYHHVLLTILVVNVAVMAAETLDGPRFGSTQPGYPYLPGDSFFLSVENAFSVVYILDFVLRSSTAPSQKAYWRDKYTWINFIAWIPALIYQGFYVLNKNDPSFNSIQVRASINYLRVARLFRIIQMTRVYVGSKIMFKATKASIAPLKITLFFLITVVMVFATAIFYAEPCYDLKTCTFTDIFNAGYFVMVTVATVGYGSQVPSLHNGASVVLSILVMIFGSLYLAMPLAIVGIRYDHAWREYEQKKREASQSSQLSGSTFLSQVATVAGSSAEKDVRTLQEARETILKRDQVDDTLQPLESATVYTASYQICDRFYGLSQKIGEITELVRVMFDESCVKSSSSSASPQSSALVASGGDASDDKATMSQLQRVKVRNDTIVQVLENIMATLKMHKKISAEVHDLLPVMNQPKPSVNPRLASATRSINRRDASFVKTASGVFGRARRALSSVTGSRRERFAHLGPATWRSRTWDLLEHNDFSRRAKIVNRIRLYLVILSIALFYAQTTPELQATGIHTSLCRRSLADFCHTLSPGFADQPGCFVLQSNGTPTSTPVDFGCHESAEDATCYGKAYNFGSDLFLGTCAQAFGRKGIQRICNNRLCKPPVTLWIDMEGKWIGFEFFFGIVFTAEMILRVIVHPEPKRVYRDLIFVIDLIALFPFYVEVAEISSGTMPMYAVVPTAPSFFAVIRVFKTFRVLKLGPHISGSEVLARTGRLVFKRLMIPVFFLFIGSIMAGAIFYELERGTECFVGKPCVYWGKELLTPSIVSGFPPGKRLQVQNNHLTQITDMLRSTWFSIVTMTTVGYGDMRPRTALGRFFDILWMIVSACYTAMPLTLVGGQFYVCYEVHLRDKRRRRDLNTVVEPKEQATTASREVAPPAPIKDKDTELREPALMSLSGLTDDPVIPGLNAPIASTPSIPATSSPALVARRGIASMTKIPKEPPRPTISSVELQFLNHFILVAKVLNEVLEDLSQLNKLGSQLVAVKKDNADELANLLRTESEIQLKIDNNLIFCASVLLNFAPVIERILGLQDPLVVSNGLAMPSIHPSAAMENDAAVSVKPPDPAASDVLDGASK